MRSTINPFTPRLARPLAVRRLAWPEYALTLILALSSAGQWSSAWAAETAAMRWQPAP